jgi:putative transcriptional regulator
MRIDFRMEKLLEERGHTLYWLAKTIGVDYTTIHRFKSGKAAGVTFDLLARMCEALECTPGDLLIIGDDKPESKKKAKSKG